VARPFYQATAEQLVLVAEAIVSLESVGSDTVAEFTDLPLETAGNALHLATDMGLLRKAGEQFRLASPLCKLLRTPQDREKAAILRIAIESYEPFQVFREEHEATNSVTEAAQRTKVKLDLSCHREELKATLLSLATYAGALSPVQGNTYTRDAQRLTALLDELVAGSREIADAEQTVRDELGARAGDVDYEQIIRPLVTALRHAAAGAGREAVLQAGIAVENFLTATGVRQGIDLTGANGINAKMQRIVDDGCAPKKILNISKYLGHLRNAADHGVDEEIGATWAISQKTGRNYIFVATSFVRSVLDYGANQHEL